MISYEWETAQLTDNAARAETRDIILKKYVMLNE